jgi:hypothetical protein
MEWSKQEKKIARKAFSAAYERECMVIEINARKMAEGINEPSDMWKIHDYLTEKRNEIDQKYDYRYSILLSLFARLMCKGWIKEEELTGFSDEKLQEIHQKVDFYENYFLITSLNSSFHVVNENRSLTSKLALLPCKVETFI